MEPDKLEGLNGDSRDMHAAAYLLLECREHVDDESKRLTEYQAD